MSWIDLVLCMILLESTQDYKNQNHTIYYPFLLIQYFLNIFNGGFHI